MTPVNGNFLHIIKTQAKNTHIRVRLLCKRVRIILVITIQYKVRVHHRKGIHTHYTSNHLKSSNQNRKSITLVRINSNNETRVMCFSFATAAAAINLLMRV